MTEALRHGGRAPTFYPSNVPAWRLEDGYVDAAPGLTIDELMAGFGQTRADLIAGARRIEWLGMTNKYGWRWKGTLALFGVGELLVCTHYHGTRRDALKCAVDKKVEQGA